MRKSFREMIEEERKFSTAKTSARRVTVRPAQIDMSDREVAQRLVTHAARRVIRQHKEEIQALAYK